MAFDKATSTGYLTNHLTRLFQASLHRRIRPYGLSPGVFPALLELWDKDGLTQRELVDRLDIEQATMANTLSRMERDGLIERRPHPTDRRAQQVWLTDAGRRCQNAAILEAIAVNDCALAELDEDEQRLLTDMLQRMIACLSEEKRKSSEEKSAVGGGGSVSAPNSHMDASSGETLRV